MRIELVRLHRVQIPFQGSFGHALSERSRSDIYLPVARIAIELKITTGAGGQEVYVGKSCDRAKWEDAIEYSSGCPWWILQEACEIPEWELPVLDDGEVKLEKKLVNVNPYLFDGEYAGSVARVSTSSVINVAAGGGIMPVFEEAR